MAAYESNEEDWSKYAFADKSRAYTRNLVDSGNGKANLVGDCLCLCLKGHSVNGVIALWRNAKLTPSSPYSSSSCGLLEKDPQSTTMPTLTVL